MENTYTLKIYSHRTATYRKEYNGLTIEQLPSFYDNRYHDTAAMIVHQRPSYNYILIKEK